jgi:hypothetical protein
MTNIWDKPAFRQHKALAAANPYARPHLRDAFTAGWRDAVAGREYSRYMRGSERNAYAKGFTAGEHWKAERAKEAR